MEIKDKLIEDFLQGIKEAENILSALQFEPFSYKEMGFAYSIQYKNAQSDNIVQFLFGPSNWNVEMIIYSRKGKFAFKDLLQIPIITKWVNNNRYTQKNGRNVKNEILYFIELLKISLPVI